MRAGGSEIFSGKKKKKTRGEGAFIRELRVTLNSARIFQYVIVLIFRSNPGCCYLYMNLLRLRFKSKEL